MKRWTMLVVLVLCVAVASTAFAQRIPGTAVKMDDPATVLGGSGVRGDCTYGNLNPVWWNIPGWVWGDEGYKFLVYPPEYTSCPCQLGFFLESVTMHMNFVGPVSMVAYCDLEDAEWDELTQCWVPGIVDCVSGLYQFDIPDAGHYSIPIPMEPENCDCAFLDYYYFISFHIETIFLTADRPGLITDNFPVPCLGYNNYGSGWLDCVADLGLPGNPLLYAEVNCCDFPIATENDTWGGVKNLYE